MAVHFCFTHDCSDANGRNSQWRSRFGVLSRSAIKPSAAQQAAFYE
jgi:hypothetical protein